jgi:hypothetical protein
MKMNPIIYAAVAACALGGASVAFAGAHEGGPEITGEGACTYVEENMFAGPFDLCQSPVGPESCAALGETGDNRDAVHSDGACPTEGLVGICDLGSNQKHYMSGDAGGLEIGCGFQGGDWISGE